MAEYLVTWRIDMEADNAEEAAAMALIVMRDAESTAVVFETVEKESGAEDVVDLNREGE